MSAPQGSRIARFLRSPTARKIYVGLAILVTLILWANMVRRALKGSGSQYDDFVTFSRDLLYRGVNVYEEYAWPHTITKYPPFFGFLLAPFVPLPTALGASLWFFLNLGLAVATAYVSVRTVVEDNREISRAVFVIPFLLAAGIIGSNLETAQVNIVILFLVCLGLHAFRRGADTRSGLYVGVAAALKLTPGLLVVYFAYKKAFRAVVGAALGVAVCWLVLPIIVMGVGDYVEVMRGWVDTLVPYLARGTLAEGIEGFRHTNQSMSAVFHRFFTRTPAGAGREGFYLNVLSIGYDEAERVIKVASLGILAFLGWIARTPATDRRRLGLSFEYSLVLIATLFISPISWINHYVVLLFPYTALVYYVWTRPPTRDARRAVIYGLAASFVLVSSSASRLMQAFSLPFVGAVIAAIALVVALRDERARAADPGGAPPHPPPA